MSAEAIIQVPEASILLEHAPTAVLREAQTAAAALRDVISAKPKKVIMNGEQYLEFEDWQTCGRFYGITAKEDGDPEFVTLGAYQGFKASAVAIDRDGREVSRATAYCLNDEEKWRSRPKYDYHYELRGGGTSPDDPGPDNIVWEENPNKPGKNRPKKMRVLAGEEQVPLFQLSSMAQTRACAKALRNVLSWVVVLAGYRTTPAEEIQDMPGARTAQTPQGSEGPAEREPGSDDDDRQAREAYERAGVDPPRGKEPNGSGPKPPCPKCKSPKHVIKSKFPKAGATWYCLPSAGGCGEKYDPVAQ